jgi:hypothetical protein
MIPLPKHRAALAALSLFLALVQFRLIVGVLGEGYGASMQAAMGVVEGKPHWRLYQNRVLGPYAVHVVERLTQNYLASYVGVTLGLLTLAGILAWVLGRRLGGVQSAFSAILLFHLAFAFLLAKPWLYAWDYVGAVVYLAFVYGVVAGKSWPWFLGLCAVAAFNRESVYFIALWMLLDPVVKYQAARRFAAHPAPFDRGMAGAGLACLLGSLGLVEFLRETLLVQEMGPLLWPQVRVEPGASFHFKLLENIDAIVSHTRLLASLLIFVAGVAGLCLYLIYQDPYRWAALALVHLGLIVSLFLFGVLPESRIFIELIPVLILGALTLTGDAEAAGPPGR